MSTECELPADGSGQGNADGHELRIWRPSSPAAVVIMQARGLRYRCEPFGEYLVSHIAHGGMRVARGRDHYLMQAGDLGVWDPTAAHRGWSVDGAEVRLLLVERPSFAEVATDPDGCSLDFEFPDPVLTESAQARSFLRLHDTLASSISRLERESAFAAWLLRLTTLATARSRRHPQRAAAARRDPALRRACEVLHDDLTGDITLGALATEAGTSTYRLIRLFKTGLGLPPHAYQIQLRVQKARMLLEAGHPPAQVTHLTGFYDQSHLNRQFTRRIGLTPAAYARAVRGAGRADRAVRRPASVNLVPG